MTTPTSSSPVSKSLGSGLTGLVAGLAMLAIAGCGEREPSTTFKKHVTSEPDDSGYSIATGVGGRPDTARGMGDPLRYAYYGLPLTDPLQPQVTPLFNLGYVVGYDHEHQSPRWAAYRLFASNGADKQARSDKAGSTVDPRVAKAEAPAQADVKPAAKPDDYDRKSGVTRRQLVPAGPIDADYGDDAAAETRLDSAIAAAPVEADNAWNTLAGLEPAYAQAYNELWVVTGPLFDGDKHLPSGAALPSGFWKIQVTVQDGRTKTQAFIIPAQPVAQKQGAPVDLANHLVPIAEIEAKTGLTFFNDFHESDGDTLESMKTLVSDGLWPTDPSQPQPVAAQKASAKTPSTGKGAH